ncbi:MAG: hypothetical protein IJT95_02340 [Abditibacteriota bacterium]|nr:hypothetical protein [Abditibacteriota bacterium]
MNKYLITALIVTLLTVTGAYAKSVSGMIKSVDNGSKNITIATKDGDVSVRADASSSLTRGLVNTKPFEVGLLDYSPGDSITCEVNDNNVITKASAAFDMVSGTITAIDGRVLSVDDGDRTVDYTVAEKCSIYLESSSVLVSVDKLKVGNSFYARINPENKNIWTLIVVGFEDVKPVNPAKTEPAKTEPAKTEPAKTEPAKTEPAKTEPAKTEPAKTEPAKTEPAKTEPAKIEPADVNIFIDDVTVSAPDSLKSGDIILVNVKGASRAGVSCDLRYVDGTKTVLSEESAGSYVGFMKIPAKALSKAKLMVYMSSRGVNISSDSGYVVTVDNKNALVSKIGTVTKLSPAAAPAETPAAPADAPAAPAETPAAPAETPAAPAETPAAPADTPAAPAETPAAPADTPAAPAETPAAPAETPAAPAETPAAPAETPAAPAETPSVEAPSVAVPSAPAGELEPGAIEGAAADSQDPAVTEGDRGIYILSPVNNAGVKDITVSGRALPGRMLICTVMYSNNKNGILNISGVLKSEVVTVREDGGFTFGPVELKGVFATGALKYYVTVSYADQELSDVPSQALTLCYE